MAQENVLDKIRKQIESANQGNTNGGNQVNLNPNAAPNPGGFSIANGMMQAPGSRPKTLSGSYMS